MSGAEHDHLARSATAQRICIASFMILSVCAVPSVARAWRGQVYYNPTNQFAVDSNNTMHFVEAIRQVMREWEQHSYGAIVMEYRGVSYDPPCGGENIRIMWDPTLPSGQCMFTDWYWPFAACPTGQIRINPTFAWQLFWRPNGASAACTSLQASLMHEFAHYFRQTGDHPRNSVLTQIGPGRDLIARHLWNDDISGIAYTWAPFRLWFESRTLRLQTELYDPASGSTTVLATGLLPDGIAHTAAPGGAGQMYAMASVSQSWLNGISVVQGDGANWSAPVVLPWQASTTRLPCLVTNVAGNDMYVIYVSIAEQAPQTPPQPGDGQRSIWMVESHDNGATWATPSQIPYAFTRTGLSCTFDLARSRIVVAYSGSGEEGIWLTSRSATAVGAGGWSVPNRVMATGILADPPTTPEPPMLAMDPFAFADGHMTWQSSELGNVWLARIAHNGSVYEVSGAAGSPFPVTAYYDNARYTRRSPPVLNEIDGVPHIAYSLNIDATHYQQYRQRNAWVTPPASSIDSYFAPPSSSQMYTAAAANRVLVETMYVSQYVNP